ncbi:MAG: hypothetical protein HYX68_02255 [Planctomycetes bacterium]|nr:hypothetical protein [Planctomycetota bacterium]
MRHVWLGFALAVWLTNLSATNAQALKKPAAEPNYSIWKTDEGIHVKGMSLLLGQGSAFGVSANPYGALMARRLFGENEFNAEAGWSIVFDRVIPMTPRHLRAIQDDRPLPVIYEKDPAKTAPLVDQHWYVAFIEALSNTLRTPEANFKKSAQLFATVAFPQLRARPWVYRGKIITVTGKLAVLRREDAPRLSDRNLEYIYTGYVIGPTPGAPPFTIILTELPQGVEKPAEKLDLNVTFQGYFLSFVRFPADKRSGKKDAILSPYLVGKIVAVNANKKGTGDGADQPYSATLIATVLGAFITIALAVVAMNLWHRRGDRRIQSKLAEVRDRHNPFNVEPADENPPADEKPKGDG